MAKRFRRLNQEETGFLRDAISRHHLSYLGVAKKLDTPYSYVHKMLTGNMPLRKKYATKIYELLERDKSVEFLMDYNEMYINPEGSPFGDTEAAWLYLYNSYCKKLGALVMNKPMEDRVGIIGKLEELIKELESRELR